MAIRISRRAKYLAVLAVISVLLYGSFGTEQFPGGYNLRDLQPLATGKAFDEQPGSDSFKKPFKTPNELDSQDAFGTKPNFPKEIDEDAPTDFEIPKSEQGSVESVPIPGKIPIQPPVKSADKTPEVVVIPEQDVLATELAALDGDQTVSPTKNLLPATSPQEKGEHEKFQLGRKEKYPVAKDELIKLPAEAPSAIPKIQTADPSLTETKLEKQVRLERQMEIRDIFKRDWAAYKRYAWMHDELKPVSNSSNDPFGGWGATLVDSLDTMLIMGLEDEYEEASEAVAKIDFTYTAARQIPLFETTIRYLGGLLAAYDLSVAKGKKDSVMLTQAKILGQVLYGAFDTPNRLPMLKYNYRKQAATSDILRAEKNGVMAEAGSLSVEFTRLAQLSDGDDRHKYFDAIQRITNAFEESMDYMEIDGLWPLKLDFSGCKSAPEDLVKKPLASGSGSGIADAKAGTSPGGINGDIPSEPKAGAATGKSLPGSAAAGAGLTDTKVSSTMSKPALNKADQATNELIDILKDHQSATKKIGNPVQAKRQVTKEYDFATSDLEDLPIVKESVAKCEPQGIRPPSDSQIYSQGGQADSTYEYFTKEYLLLGGSTSAQQYKKLYERSIEATRKSLLFKPLVPGDLGAHEILMSGEVETKKNKEPELHAKMQHLTCFIGGMFAMGSKVFSRPEDLKIAAKLTDGCVWAYQNTPAGVAPEVFHMHECKDDECKWQDFLDETDRKDAATQAQSMSKAPEWAADDAAERQVNTPKSSLGKRQVHDRHATSAASPPAAADTVPEEPNFAAALAEKSYTSSQKTKARVPPPKENEEFRQPMFWLDSRYILRPEAIESVWYMYRITGDKSWQEKGWAMWKSTESLTRTPIAHTAVYNLMDPDNIKRADSLESFWFAETLKYYYLLFSDFQTVSLDEWVLNTEAHPFKRV